MTLRELPQLPPKSLISRVKFALRYRLSPSYRKLVDAEGRWNVRRLEAAHALMEEERAILEEAWPRLGFRLKEDMVQAFEVHMIWGLFNEAEKLRTHLETTVEDRTMLQVMYFLMLYRGFKHSRAVNEIESMRTDLHAEDRFAEVLVNYGRNAAASSDRGQMLSLVIAFHDSGLKPEAYA